MKLHGSAVLSQRQRRRLVLLVGPGMTIAAAAALVGCSRQTGSKWVNRYRRGEGLEDRSSRPHRSPRRVSDVVEQAVLQARRELRAGPHIVGWATGVAASKVHAILRRHGCSRLAPRLPREQIVRYERERPGELVHVDVKKLGRIVKPSHRVTGDRRDRNRGAGWQYLFVAQGRALHPHPARALGLRLQLRQRGSTRCRTPRRTRLLQSLPATPRPRRADAASARQRPIWDEQLVRTTGARRPCRQSGRSGPQRTAPRPPGPSTS